MAWESARAYLTRVVPWIDGAYVNLHWTTPNPKFDPAIPEGRGNKRQYLRGQAFTSVDDALSSLGYLLTRRTHDSHDMYLCMSSQQNAEARVYGGRQFFSAIRSAGTVAGLKALYIDLDVKPDGYATPAQAFAEARRFIGEVGLPRPTLAVSSGTGGAHLYWVLDQTLSRDDWQPLADALAEATRRHGFKVDTACTVDSARLLRVPQSLNYKATPPLPVTMANRIEPHDVPLDAMRKILLPYMGARVISLPNAKAPPLKSELAAGIQAPQAPLIDIDSVAKLCGFVNDALSTGGAANAQPLWNLSTLLATFTLSQRGDGRWAAHEMARGHAGYVQGDTDALYDRKVAEKDARNLGWPSCAAIQNAGCTSCASCPLRPQNRSPLTFGTPHTAAVVPVTNHPPGPLPQLGGPSSPLPNGYIYLKDGTVAKLEYQTDGTSPPKQLTAYPIHSPWLQHEPRTLHFSAHISGQDQRISILVENLQVREYAKFLAKQGMVLYDSEVKNFREFLVAFVQMLQAKRETVASAPFGWVRNGMTYAGFAYNGRLFTPAGERAASIAPDLAQLYDPVGELEPWKRAARIITDQRRPALDTILAASFGAPLMVFTGQSGCILSAYSIRSGIGKSTAMEVAMSVWGHPKLAMNSLSDTRNSAIDKISRIRSLPIFWDEIKGDDQKLNFVTFAFEVSGGKSKARLSSEVSQRAVGSWQTLFMAASNDSLLDTIANKVKSTEAGVMRVFEYEVSPAASTVLPHSVVARIISECQHNYGNAGMVYSAWLGANAERIKSDMSKVQDKLVAVLQAPNEERFWIASIAACMLGANYSNMLGLTQIDLNGLSKFLCDSLRRLRKLVKGAHVSIEKPEVVEDVLASFLGDMAPTNTLVTAEYSMIGRPRNDMIILNDHPRIGVVNVRHAQKDQVLVIDLRALHDWLQKHNYNPYTYIEALAVAYPGSIERGMRNLTVGTRFNIGTGMRTRALVFKYANTPFAASAQNATAP